MHTGCCCKMEINLSRELWRVVINQGGGDIIAQLPWTGFFPQSTHIQNKMYKHFGEKPQGTVRMAQQVAALAAKADNTTPDGLSHTGTHAPSHTERLTKKGVSWYSPLIPVLRRQRRADRSLVYIVSLRTASTSK